MTMDELFTVVFPPLRRRIAFNLFRSLYFLYTYRNKVIGIHLLPSIVVFCCLPDIDWMLLSSLQLYCEWARVWVRRRKIQWRIHISQPTRKKIYQCVFVNKMSMAEFLCVFFEWVCHFLFHCININRSQWNELEDVKNLPSNLKKLVHKFLIFLSHILHTFVCVLMLSSWWWKNEWMNGSLVCTIFQFPLSFAMFINIRCSYSSSTHFQHLNIHLYDAVL